MGREIRWWKEENKDHVLLRIRGNKRKSVREYYRPDLNEWKKEPELITRISAQWALAFKFNVRNGYRYKIERMDQEEVV